jgi:hypothetical protein
MISSFPLSKGRTTILGSRPGRVEAKTELTSRVVLVQLSGERSVGHGEDCVVRCQLETGDRLRLSLSATEAGALPSTIQVQKKAGETMWISYGPPLPSRLLVPFVPVR